MTINAQENQQHEDHCQSCGMPLPSRDMLGTENNGEKSKEYCMYCYEDGAFKQPDLTMNDMVEVCVPFMVQEGMAEQTARDIMRSQLPHLQRWSAKRGQA